MTALTRILFFHTMLFLTRGLHTREQNLFVVAASRRCRLLLVLVGGEVWCEGVVWLQHSSTALATSVSIVCESDMRSKEYDVLMMPNLSIAIAQLDGNTKIVFECAST